MDMGSLGWFNPWVGLGWVRNLGSHGGLGWIMKRCVARDTVHTP